MAEEASTVRLVRCPKCENLLPELPEYSVYRCGGCGAVLRGNSSTPSSEKRPLEKSDNESIIRSSSKIKNVNNLENDSQTARENDDSNLGRKKGRIVHEKITNLTASSSSRNDSSKKEKRESFTDSDQNRRRRLDFDQNKVKVFDTFQRNASFVEKGRFGNLPYSNEGPSSCHLGSFNSFGDHIRNHSGLTEPSRVQDLENDRNDLLKKLDELRTQLSRSCNVAENHWLPHQQSLPLPRQQPLLPPHQQYLPPPFHDPFLGYSQSSCTCSQCYNTNWHQIPPRIRPFSSFHSQETMHPGPEPQTYYPPQPPCHLDSGRRYPRRRVIITHPGERVFRPLSNGAPFLSCCNCFELLKIPRKITNNHATIKCGACHALISLKLENNKIVSSGIIEQKVNKTRSTRSPNSSRDYDNLGYKFQATDTEPNLSTSEEQSPDSVIDKSSSPIPYLESQNDKLTKSQRTDLEVNNKKSLKDALVATEIDVSLTEYLNCGVVSKEEDDSRSKKGANESFFAGLIKKRLKDFSRSEKGRSDVFVNGQLLTDRVVKKAEKLAGPIHPGEYWYDYLAGFWGVMNQPCLGIIPPFIEEFDHPMPKNCAAGNTGVFVNGRELNKKDLDLLAGRGLPTMKDKSYIIDISGKVVDEDTGEELDGLGKLAPTVERVKHGFGMKVPEAVSK